MDLIRQMRYYIKKNGEERQQRKTADIQQQIDGNAENEKQKHANEMQRIDIEGKIKMQEELIRGQIKDRQSNKEMVRDVYAELREASNAEDGINTSVRR